MIIIRPGDEDWTEDDDAFFDEVEQTGLVLLPDPVPEGMAGDADTSDLEGEYEDS